MKHMMAMVMATLGVVCFSLLAMTGLIACERQQPSMEAKPEAPAPKVEAAPAVDSRPEIAPTETTAVLMAPEGSAGRAHNEEGVAHARLGHWDVAEGHFRNAIQTDPKLAEAQFNLGLMLVKLGKHDEAKAAFKKAVELAPDNPKITESPILKQHMPT
ncbi:MAG: tetratricopeptide repeat protein [Nitrospira sp.]|nr:tetratricopeptide repeat protein [Nitrospira sp.]